MTNSNEGLPGDDTPDMQGKTLTYDASIYKKDKLTPEDLKILHDRADGIFDKEKLEKHLNDLGAGKEVETYAKSLSNEEIEAILKHKDPGQVEVSVDVSPGVPIHCSYFPGAKTAELSVPINVTVNGNQGSGSISQDLTIPAALYLLDQLNAFVRGYLLRVVQP